MEVLPLLQCLGHVEYILRHPQTRALRESGDLTQFCPQEPASLALWRELADEVLAAHPEARYFHLGADEAWRLGDCPRCRAVAGERGKLALYLEHVNAAAAHIRAAGRQPIIWDDMVQRNLDANGLAALPADGVLCSWAYGPSEPRDASLYYGGSEGTHRYRWVSRQWVARDPAQAGGEVHWLEEAPEAVQAFARRYWDQGEYPLYGAALPGALFRRTGAHRAGRLGGQGCRWPGCLPARFRSPAGQRGGVGRHGQGPRRAGRHRHRLVALQRPDGAL